MLYSFQLHVDSLPNVLCCVQINDTLQGQVTKLTADNNSFQGHVKNLQETTSSLSAQIAVLAIQAKAAAVNATQLQVILYKPMLQIYVSCIWPLYPNCCAGHSGQSSN